MSSHKVWVIEELLVDGSITHRQSVATYELNQVDDSWHWTRPDDRMTQAAKDEWDAVMTALSNVGGRDLRHIVCGVGLMDHCLDTQNIDEYV